MSNSCLLENILKVHRGSFDIVENVNVDGKIFSAYGRFVQRDEKYVLHRKANIWTVLGFEHILFNEIDVLEKHDIDVASQMIEGYMEPVFVRNGNRYPPKNHMYTYLTVVLISDKEIKDSVKNYIKSYKFERNYLFTVRGYSIGRIVCIDQENKEVVASKGARKIRDIYDEVLRNS